MLHAPVLQKCKETGCVSIIPLNSLPAEEELASYLAMPKLTALYNDTQLLESVLFFNAWYFQ